MKRLASHALVLVVAFLIAIGAYALATEFGEERYDLFDFLRGRKPPAAAPASPANPADPKPPAESLPEEAGIIKSAAG